MFCRSKYFLALLLLLPFVATEAAIVPDIYSARVQVLDESEAERVRGISAGLAQVIVKATGKSNLLQDIGVKDLLARARRYVSEYRYVYPERAGSGNPILQVEYLAIDIAAALRDLQLPVWPADRPPLLLWMTQTSANDRNLVNAEAPAYRSLLAALVNRGATIEIPLMDLKDQLQLGDLSIENTSQLALASARYDVEHWLLVNYQVGDGIVSGSWSLAGKGLNSRGLVEATTLTGFMINSSNKVVDHYAENFSYAPTQTTRFLNLVIENVNAYQDYQQVVEVLNSFELVRGVQVSAMQENELSLNLSLDGEKQLLFDALGRDSRFTYVAQVGASAEKVRRYVWGGL